MPSFSRRAHCSLLFAQFGPFFGWNLLTMPTAEPQNNESKRARSMWPLPALGCLCLLALLGMFAAQQHREDGLRLLAAQQELAHQQARLQDLQRQLRQCRTKRRPSSSIALPLPPASGGAPSNSSMGAGLDYVSEATLAAAELVQAEMHAGLAAENPGWCMCPPPPNYTRVCSALRPPADDEAAAAALETERQRVEAERLRGLVARGKLRLLRSDELLALAQAELASGTPREGACGGKRRGGRAREHARASQQGQKVPVCPCLLPPVRSTTATAAPPVCSRPTTGPREEGALAARVPTRVRSAALVLRAPQVADVLWLPLPVSA